MECSGHSGNDSVAYFPKYKIVAAGDEVEENPAIDYPSGASVAGWLACLDSIARLDFLWVVPGHGPAPMTKAEFLRYKADVETFAARARAAAKLGTAKDHLFASIKVDDLSWRPTNQRWKDPSTIDSFFAELAK